MSDTLETTLKALEILSECDLTIVPLKPSEAMVRAGVDCGNTDPATVRKIYAAMLAAALDHDLCS